MFTSAPMHVCLLVGLCWRARGCPLLWPGSESTQQTLARPSRHAVAINTCCTHECPALQWAQTLLVLACALNAYMHQLSWRSVGLVTLMSGHTQVIMDIVGCLITCATCHLILEQLTRVLAVG